MSKARGRVRREMAAAEEEEHEGGELNLVPYLDILINTIIFLLATTASALALANINVNSPRYQDPGSAAAAQTEPDEEDQPKLNLTVAVSYKGFLVAGAGGVMKADDGTTPTIKCSGALKNDRCPAFLATRTNAEGKTERMWVDKYDYEALAKLAQQIKEKYRGERQVILTADRLIPYKVVVKTMDTLRGQATSKCTGKDGCLFDQVILSAGVQ
jgi:biopolymer transport protein ExbD